MGLLGRENKIFRQWFRGTVLLTEALSTEALLTKGLSTGTLVREAFSTEYLLAEALLTKALHVYRCSVNRGTVF